MKYFNKPLVALFLLLIFVFVGCQTTSMTSGKVYYNQNPPNYDAAIEQFKKAIEAEPQNAECYIWLGKAYAGKKKYKETCIQTEKAISIDAKKIEQLRKDTVLNYWAVYFNSAMTHLKNKEFELARKRVERSLDFEPKNIKSLNYLAYCYQMLKKGDKAEEIYKKAIKLVPKDTDAYINLAACYKGNNREKDEEAVLLQARKIVENPDWLKAKDDDIVKRKRGKAAKVYTDLGNVLLRREKTAEAEGSLKKAIELSPNDRDVNFNYGLALFKMEKYEAAIKPFKKVISIDSKDKEGYDYLGIMYLKTKRYNEAKETFTKLIEIDPSYCEAYINRAFAERELGDKSAAYEDAKIGTECKERQKNK